MALANPISWNNMCAEFGLNPTTAVFPRDFYGKGGAPAAGALGFQDFVGRSGVTFVPAPGANLSAQDGTGPVSKGITSSQPVTWTWTISGSGCTAGQAQGSVATSVSFTFAKLSSATVEVTATVNGATYSWTITGTGGGA